MKRKPLVTWFPFRFALLIAPLVAAWPQRAYSVDRVWDVNLGAGPWVWNAGANWTGGTAPTTNADRGDLRKDWTAAATINFNAATTINGILFDDTGAASDVGVTIANGGTAANTLTLAGTTPIVQVDGSTLTISTIMAGSTAWSKTGAGLLILSGANTYTSAVTVSAGTLRLGNALGLGTSAGGVTVAASGAVLDLSGQTVVTEAATINGSGISGAGAFINSSGTAASWSGTVAMASASSIGGGGSLTVSGIVSGAFGLTKVGVGATTLSAANTYSGTTITNGVLVAGNNGALGTGGVNISGTGRLRITQGITVANNITVDAGVTGVGTSGLIERSAGTNTGIARVNGTITLNGSPGAGGTFYNNSNAVGSELVIGGAIGGSATAFSQRDGRVIYAGGGAITGTFLVTGTAVAGANNGIPTGLTVQLGGSGNGTLELNGFNQTLTGLQLGNSTPANAFTSTVNLGGNTLTLNGNITNVSDATQAVTHVVNGTAGGLDLGAVNRTINVVNGTNAEDVVLNLAFINGAGGLTKTGLGNLSLGNTAGTATVAGPLTISAGALTVGRDNLPSNLTVGGIDFAAGTTLNVNVGTGGDLITATTATSAGVTVNLSQFGGALANGFYPIVSYSGTTPGIANFTSSGLPGRVAGGLLDNGSAIGLNVTGNDKVIWDGTNSTAWATGATGNWKLLSDNSATDYLSSDDVIFNNSPTNSSVVIGATVTPSNVTFNNTTTTTYSLTGAGGIAGPTGLTKNGDGTTTLATPNSYAGATAINAGTLVLDHDAPGNVVLSGTSGISVAAGAKLLLTRDDGAFTMNRSLSGSGTLEINPHSISGGVVAHSVVLSGDNSAFSGPIRLLAPTTGTWRLSSPTQAQLGSGALTVDSGAQFFTASNATYSNAITVTGTGYDDGTIGFLGGIRAQGTTTFNGALTVAGTAKFGTFGGNMIVANTLSGGTLTFGGSLLSTNGETLTITGNAGGLTGLVVNDALATAGGASITVNVGNNTASGTLGAVPVSLQGDGFKNAVLRFDRTDGYTLGAAVMATSPVAANHVRTFVDSDTLGTGFSDGGLAINLGGSLATTGGFFRVGQNRAGAIASLTGALTAGTVLVGSGQGTATLNLNSGAVANVGTARVAAAGANTTSTLNINNGASITAFSLGLGELNSASGVVNQAAGSTVNIDAQLRVGHFATNTSIYNMNGGTLTMTGASPLNTPSTAVGGGASLTGDNNINAALVPALVGGGIYIGTDGTGIFNHNAGTVTTNWMVLDNRAATGAGANMADGLDRYNLSGASSELVVRSTWGIIGRNEGSYVFSLGGGTIKVGNDGTGTGTGPNINIPLDVTINAVASTSTNLDTNGAGNGFTLTKDAGGTGTLNLTGGGTVNLSTTGFQSIASAISSSGSGAGITKVGAGTTTWTGNASGYTGNITVAAGRINLPTTLGAGSLTVADGAAIGGEPVQVTTLNLGSVTGSTIFFDPNTAGALSTTNLVVAGTNSINLTAAPAGAGPYTVINTINPRTGAGTFVVADAGNYRTAPTVIETPTSVQVGLTAGFDLIWSGATNAWNINSAANWNADTEKFYTMDKVTFAEAGANPAVVLSGLLAPASITVNAATTAYTLTSTAGNQLTGATGITKSGAGTLTLAGPNLHTGTTSAGGGIINFSDPASLGSGAVGNGIALSGGGILRYTAATGFNLGVNRGIAVGSGGGMLSHNNTTAASIIIDGNLTGSAGNALSLQSNSTGAGTFILSGNNSGFSGDITVDSVSTGYSTLQILSNSASPGGGSITLNYPAAGATQTYGTLNLPGTTLAAGVTLNMTSFLNGALSLRSQVISAGNASIEGPITASGTAIVQLVPATGTLTVNGNTTVGGGGFNASTSVYFLRGAANGIMNGTITLPDASVTKTDAGSWTINSTGNSWANTGISTGTVIMGAANVLPPTANLTMGQNDTGTATLNLNGFNQTVGSLTSNPAAVNANSPQKSITSASAATLTVNQFSSTTYASLLTGSLSLVKSGTGVLTLAAPTSTFNGNVLVSGGTLVASSAAAAPAGANGPLGAGNVAGKSVTVSNAGTVLSFTSNNIFGNGQANLNLPEVIINQGATLDSTRYNVVGELKLNGGTLSQTSTDPGGYQGFALRGNVTVGGSVASSILTTNGKGTHLGTDTTFAVADATGNAANDLIVNTPLLNPSADFGGIGGFTKAGPGTMSLDTGVTSAYTGPTLVSGGVLNVNGSIASSSSLSVGSGASVTGTGTLPANVNFGAGAIFAPGNSAGTITTTGSVVFNSTSVLNYELKGDDTTVGGNVNDLLTGVTNLTLGGTLNVAEIGTGSFLNANLGNMWRIMDYNGTLTGTLAVGSYPALLDPAWSLAVDTTTANQVNLVVVPETSAVSLLGLATLFTLRRRRSRHAA